MDSEPPTPERAGSPPDAESYWRQRFDELQKRVTRFSAVEQELINTRNRLDRELNRFERIHSFNTRAIHARTDAVFATIVAEAIVDVFEVEFGALWLGEAGVQPAALAGLPLTDATAGAFTGWLRQRLSGPDAARPSLLGRPELAEMQPLVPLRQVIIAACHDASGRTIGFLAGGITDARADFHDSVGAGDLESFEVFTQQVSALIENRRDQAIIEQQIRQIEISEKRLILALEGSSAGLWDWNLPAGEVFFSAQWPVPLGHTLAELRASPEEWHGRVHPEDLPSLLADFQAHLAGWTEQFENTHRMRHRDGHYVWMLTRGRALRNPAGEPFRVVGTHLDISAQKELERRLREAEEDQRLAREQAETANRAKTAFLATMSHEIRTPLNGVLGAVQLLRDLQLSADQLELVDAAEESATGLLEIVGDILDLTKIESGKLELESRTLALPATLREVLAAFEARAKAKGLTLTISLADALPAHVSSDPARLRQILGNLIGNAIKFTDTGGVTVSATVKAKEAARQWIEFSVRDTGIGIAPEVQSRLFSAFVQADSSTTRRFGGTGLGLAISRRLVELMGGEIRVISEPGRGADFRFQLPLTTAELPPAEPAPLPAGTRFAGRVLVAEDNLIGQKIAPAMLRKMGLTVDIANNGREAVERFNETRYDVIFMDCHMPEMDGYEATLIIRRQEALLPPAAGRAWIIALTANAMSGEREHCLSVGMDDHLAKPFKIIQLQAVLLRACHAGVLSVPTRSVTQPVVPRPATDFEPGALDQLCAELDTASVCEIVRDFLNDLPTRPSELEQLCQEERFSELERAAHSLKGLSVQFGLMPLAHHSLAIEAAAEASDAASLPSLLAKLPREMLTAAAALESWLKRQPSA